MSVAGLLKRVEKLEKQVRRAASACGIFPAECICFPPSHNERPVFGFYVLREIAFKVKCPLHGDRFTADRLFLYVPKWLRERDVLRRRDLSPQFQKAWAASFPPDLWPDPHEEVEEGEDTFLLLKDGSRLLVYRPNYGSAKRVAEISGLEDPV